MKTQNLAAIALAMGFVASAVYAESPPATPAPAPGAVTDSTPASIQIVYTPRLPGVAELTKVATAQGLTVKQITQSAREVSIVYRTADGKEKTVSYQLLADASASPAQVVAPTVVYAAPASPVYYYDPYDPYYYPGYWYPPVSVRLGFSFGYGFRGGRGRRW